MASNFSPNQSIRKPIVRSAGGVVAAQQTQAAAIGARVLDEGGNAVDAAVATSFALGVCEPWMSGMGGGGLMVVRHQNGQVHAVDFGMRAPGALNIADYPVEDGTANDLFAWPAVRGDANMIGPHAIAVPGVVDGIACAHNAWGTRDWDDLLTPAIDLARRGLTVDWYATLVIAQAARGLSQSPASAARFLPDGVPPRSPMVASSELRLSMDGVADTLVTLAKDGPRSFYEGAIANRIAEDIQRLGGSLSKADLAAYHAKIVDPLEIKYREATIWATPELSAGPTLADTLRRLEAAVAPGKTPDAAWFCSFATALGAAYKARLASMGDVENGRSTGCTTHFSVTDKDGMTVSVTQTLLSVFGSMVTLPDTGILMNNGIFWFDPRQGKPNSLAPSKRCLSNMCPIVLESAGKVFGIGASGGRRILPAVAQIAGFLTDFDMDLEDALHMPRIDSSGSGPVLCDSTMPNEIRDALDETFEVLVKKRSELPSWFANISTTGSIAGQALGGSEPSLPWSDAFAAKRL
jgi:gamma-glutamyltranspeptidase/glutathione hydrolase